MKISLIILIAGIMQNQYKILTVKKLTAHLAANKIDLNNFDTCLETNHCYVYYLKNGEAVLLPNRRLENSHGVLFLNKNDLVNCIQNDSFPIENENMTIEEKYKTEIENINRSIDSIIESVGSQKKVIIKDQNLITTDLISNLLKVSKSNVKKKDEKNLFYSALILGEFLRKKNNGNWILLKKYGTFNPYYTPAIIYPDNSILLFWDYLKSYFKDSAITPEIFASLPYIKNPGLKLESTYFHNNFYGYKKLK